jgi:hypothetical protein
MKYDFLASPLLINSAQPVSSHGGDFFDNTVHEEISGIKEGTIYNIY